MSPAQRRIRAAYARAEQFAAVGMYPRAERVLREMRVANARSEALDLQALAAERAGELHIADRMQRAEGYAR